AGVQAALGHRPHVAVVVGQRVRDEREPPHRPEERPHLLGEQGHALRRAKPAAAQEDAHPLSFTPLPRRGEGSKTTHAGVCRNLRGRPQSSHSITYRSPCESTVSACGLANLSGWLRMSFGWMPRPSPSWATILSSASMTLTRASSSGTYRWPACW